MSQLASSEASSEDGRVARRLDNRVRILNALFLLIRSGNSHPTLKQIADNAGVTSRTLLNHFPDMGSLVLAAATRFRGLARNQLPAIPEDPDPETRVHVFFQNMASFLDTYAAVRWATLTFPGTLPGFDQRQHKGVVLGYVSARVCELVVSYGVDLDRDPHLRRALFVMIDPLAWRLLRVQQGLSRKDAAAVMAAGVLALTRDVQRADKRRGSRAVARTRSGSRKVVPINSRVRLS
jgi:AcrR family transcriptional regulator